MIENLLNIKNNNLYNESWKNILILIPYVNDYYSNEEDCYSKDNSSQQENTLNQTYYHN